ncbi:DUF2779 domain-containing protein [Bacillus sp. OK048]|uniref:DUF2779 domain-containing protein n=1 Tax=Bacillus sp. OK048 TaxID=1882761 RepID=UPI000882AF4F|nr:DUF2779 domain-containing protein [Bacillus sp. OK048]SDN62993.1 protein of unknown function [Bacillus sp. OK048]
MLTKTDYLAFKQCPKAYWLKNNPDQCISKNNSSNSTTIDKGNMVNRVARGLFPGGNLVNYQSHQKMMQETNELISKGVSIIYEGTFVYNGLLVRCDILTRNSDGWHLYEVKSSTRMKAKFLDDLAIQTFVLQNNLPIKSVNLVYLNKEYAREGKLDLNSLFTIADVTDETAALLPTVDKDIVTMKSIVGQRSYKYDIGNHCEKYAKDDNPCIFIDLCWSHIPSYSVFNLARIGKKKFDLYQSGILKIEDIPDEYKLTKTQQIQVTALKENKDIINKAVITEFMSQFHFPLYFLDFETFQQPIPLFKGVKPYQQIPFQYSLHILEDENSLEEHREFLATAGKDPRRDLAERLVEDIPLDVCSIVYNQKFEKMVLKNLAESFPDLADHLMNIHDNIVDLMIPFEKKWVYRNEMKGSSSIKNVLPALLPGIAELDYHKLTIQNGSMAMEVYETLHLRTPEEIETIRTDLLSYCKLDTIAMVRLWQKLAEIRHDE